MKIPISKPFFDDEEIKAVLDPIRSGWVSQGPKVEEFENMFKTYIGAQYATAVNSGTSAIHLALIACGIKEGDEIITTPFTCVATVNPIVYMGAKPIFVDIDLKTFNLNVARIEEVISEKTRAILVVHLFGLSADMDSIIKLAKKYNLIVIEDAALALGAFYKGKHVGIFGDVGCFSFHPRKMITTGEGGMIVTNNKEIDIKVKALRNYGASVSAWQRHQKKLHLLPQYTMLGFNYKMTDIQASLGIVQMHKLPKILEKRRRIANKYNQDLSSTEWLITPSEPVGYVHAYQSYVCLFNPYNIIHNFVPDLKMLKRAAQKRNEFMEWLYEKGIATVPGAQAIHTVSYYRKKYGFNIEDFPNALVAENLTIALPIYPQLSEEEQEYIISNIKAFKI